MQKILSFFRKSENVILTLMSLFFATNMALLTNRKSQYSIFSDSQNPDVFYLIFLLLIASLAGVLFFQYKNEKIKEKNLTAKLLLIFLPLEITLSIGLYLLKADLNVLFFLFSGTYALIASFLMIKKIPTIENETAKSQGWRDKYALAILCSVMVIAGFFGTYGIGKFSAVDEPLWTFDRIPSFWKNVGEMNWKNTNISDKPGITVAMISGAGLLEVNPKQYDPKVEGSKNLDSEKMNSAFRLPLILFAILSLPTFYLLLNQLIRKRTALISTILIGLSPILLGMSRIINPDALLWIFAPLSLLSFLIYQKNRHQNYLYLTGLTLGLSILTKYVANILYIFFFGMIFLEYILNTHRYQNISLRKYLLSSIRDFSILTLISLATFYFLYPGTWLKPERLFTGTILSQAFVSTWPIFAAFFSLLLADVIFLKNKIFKSVLGLATKNKHFITAMISGVFLMIIAFIFFNVYGDMKFYDFENILSSPKTSFKENGFLGLFLANFYPLLFAILPLAFIGGVAILGKIIFKSGKEKHFEKENIVIFFLLFIFSYYFGTTINNVVSTSRYQIMLYPIILIISSIGLVQLFEFFEKRYDLKKYWFILFAIAIVAISTFSLFKSKPFYLSYASSLLPQENFLDLKDMGPGSYEVAQYLNSLPNPEQLTIWTDKKGVCTFFKGSCYGDLSYDELEGVSFDYIAVSWGRKSRTTSMVRSQGKLASNNILNFAKYYDQEENVVFKLLIGDRPSQYIKVIKIK